jgi:hypothetical protein
MASDSYAPRLGRKLLSLIALAALLCASTAFAQPSSADKETARNLMREGDEKFAVRDYAGALKAYQAAHAIMQVPTTGLPLARAQIERGLLVEARDTLLQVSRYPQAPNESQVFAKAREEAGPLAQKISDRIPSISVSVEGPPSGASIDVEVDGVAVPVAALGTPRKINPGQHEITASAAGFQPVKKRVNVREGDNERVALRLVPAGASAASSPRSKDIAGGGRIHVVSPTEPGNVFVDGKAVGVTPLDVPVTGGAHKVEVEYAGGSHEERKVNIASGATLELSFQPSALDTVARHRKGVHLGIAGGGAYALFLEGAGPLYGGTASFVFNVGINPLLDFRSGVTLGFLYRYENYYSVAQLTAVVPAMLHVHYHPWFSLGAGLSAGFASNFANDKDHHLRLGFSVGPEWSLLTIHAGDKREFELSFVQGLRFGGTEEDYHHALQFTYLFVD